MMRKLFTLIGVASLCERAVSSCAGVGADPVSEGTPVELAAGRSCEHALTTNSELATSKRGMVCIGRQFITLR